MNGAAIKLAVLAGLLATGLLTHQSVAAVQSEPERDDALVIAAVLDATILPAYRQANTGTSAPLLVVSETSPLCMQDVRPSECRIPEQWQRFLQPDLARRWPGLVAEERIRKELVTSFENRNRQSNPLPLSAHPGTALLDLSKDPPANALDRYFRRTMGSATLTLPGYSADGHALMSGSYSCGNLCGYGWLFVLEKVDRRWQVKSATITMIS